MWNAEMMLQKCHPVMKDVHVGNKRTKQNQGRNWVVQLEMRVRLVNMHVNVRQKVEIYKEHNTTRMWANAQRDGRPAEYRWRPLFNAAKFG